MDLQIYRFADSTFDAQMSRFSAKPGYSFDSFTLLNTQLYGVILNKGYKKLKMS